MLIKESFKMEKVSLANRASDKNITILCIDDSSDNLKVLASILSENYNLVLCKSAAQGFKKALEIKPELILLDVVMPQESGFELIVRLKNENELSQIPVIFITSLNEVESEEQGLKLGAVDYIQKPFHSSIVQARVNTQLEIVRQRKLLKRIANIDVLTELPNRRKWDEDSQSLWLKNIDEKTAIVVGIVDLDFFKLYNDTYGHLQGDIVLRKVAAVISRVLYQYEGNLYRCGGEEFYFSIYSEYSKQAVNILAECVEAVQLLKIKHETTLVSNVSVVTISIGGFVVEPTMEKTIKYALGQADKSLYKIKNTTRNGVDIS